MLNDKNGPVLRVIENFLGNLKKTDCEEIVGQIVENFGKIRCLNLKLHFFDYFPTNLDYSDE